MYNLNSNIISPVCGTKWQVLWPKNANIYKELVLSEISNKNIYSDFRQIYLDQKKL